MFDPNNFQHFLDASPLPMWVYDVRTLRFVWANAAAIRRYGYALAEFEQMTILDIRPAADCQEVARLVRSAQRATANQSRVWVHLTKEGERLDVRVTTVEMLPAGCGMRLAMVEDVTSFTSMTHALEYMASHDAATGLLTMPALAKALDASALGERYELACLRLQGLTEVADLYGGSLARSVTRQVLVGLQSRLPQGLWGFQPPNALLLAHGDPQALRVFVADAARMLETPVVAEGAQWQLSLHCGLARHPEDAAAAEQVIACAALAARNRSRESDPTQPSIYVGALGERSRRRRRLAVELRRAIREGEIDVHFQPIVPANGGEGSEVARKFEALSRWRLDGQAVSPAEFVPIAESAGLSGALLRLVIGRACEAIVALRTRGIDALVTVNVPAVAAVIRDLPGDLLALCEPYGVRPDRIGIEITESALLDDDAAWRKSFALLRYMGVHVAIDDFGTGFNTLAYLDRLPADVIKLDRTFIGQLFCSDRQALICASLIRLAHGLGLQVVAEGVEDATQKQWLVRQGCDELQGYLLGRPVPLAELLGSLAEAAG